MQVFMPDDKVVYVGKTLASEIGAKQGWVIAPVRNEQGAYVVEFGDESFVVSAASLAKYNPAGANVGPEIRQFKRRRNEDEV